MGRSFISEQTSPVKTSLFQRDDCGCLSIPRLLLQSVDDMDDAKRADDTLSLSELSYQSTSDSGRGGSEFDVNNAGHKEKGEYTLTLMSSRW